MMIAYAYFYGFFTILGGLMGYLKAQSKASLVAGSISGALILTGVYLASHGHIMGLYLLETISILVTLYFIRGFTQSKKLMPAGVMVVFGLIMIALLFIHQH
jgi:uncharacterized membrane protein (UPF0136 family)